MRYKNHRDIEALPSRRPVACVTGNLLSACLPSFRGLPPPSCWSAIPRAAWRCSCFSAISSPRSSRACTSFPGGTLDEEDDSPALHAHVRRTRRCRGEPRAGHGARRARVLDRRHPRAVRGGGRAARARRRRRADLARRRGEGRAPAPRTARTPKAARLSFGAIVAAERLRLAADRLTYFSRWITPEGAVRRYDTRFFYAVAPEHQSAEHDNREAIAHEWARPGRYSRAPAARRVQAAHAHPPHPGPLRRIRYVAALIAAVQPCRRSRRSAAHRARRAVSFPANRATRKRRARKDAANGNREPDRRRMSETRQKIVPGEVVRINDLVRRITAPNPGMMTGPGTNAYIVGRETLARHRSGPRERGALRRAACRRSAAGCAGYCAPIRISIIRRTRGP